MNCASLSPVCSRSIVLCLIYSSTSYVYVLKEVLAAKLLLMLLNDDADHKVSRFHSSSAFVRNLSPGFEKLVALRRGVRCYTGSIEKFHESCTAAAAHTPVHICSLVFLLKCCSYLQSNTIDSSYLSAVQTPVPPHP